MFAPPCIGLRPPPLDGLWLACPAAIDRPGTRREDADMLRLFASDNSAAPVTKPTGGGAALPDAAETPANEHPRIRTFTLIQ